MNKISRFTRHSLLILVLLMNVGCDQLTKDIARSRLDYHQPERVIGSMLSLIKIENRGAFLSLGHNWPEWVRMTLLHVLPVIFLIIGCIILFTSRKLNLLAAAGLGLMRGGGIGKMMDRLLYGSVTDVRHMDLGLFRTGVFNLAEVSIMLGVGLMFLSQFTGKSLDSTPLHS